MTVVLQVFTAMVRDVSDAAVDFLPQVYDEVRRLTAWRLTNDLPGRNLKPTVRVRTGNPHWRGRWHFFGAALEAMRRILVENARRKNHLKRGGQTECVEMDALDIPAPRSDDELLALGKALGRFAQIDPRAAELLKLCFFIGLTQARAEQRLGVSVGVVERTWASARAWLFREISVPMFFEIR